MMLETLRWQCDCILKDRLYRIDVGCNKLVPLVYVFYRC